MPVDKTDTTEREKSLDGLTAETERLGLYDKPKTTNCEICGHVLDISVGRVGNRCWNCKSVKMTNSWKVLAYKLAIVVILQSLCIIALAAVNL
jgi:hypothetical protein